MVLETKITCLHIFIDIKMPLLTYGICQAACAAVVVACFSAAGVTFGTVPATLIAATPALAACNTAYASCYAACSPLILSPI
ncbi:hypothetical protein WA026_011474 [Henosepilachna vigintioctopunctata]|uniref:Uncharacterized protein n=1 Tax=Henosepilachna vigintioctopunctata TaxID=420089 RepID=A0AAW1TLX9_9CUCU